MIRLHQLTVYVVKCDRCGTQNRSVADGFGTPEQAFESAVAHGWWIDDRVATCPTCLLQEPCS